MRRRTGFTLIELLVVLAIVAMLLSVSMPRYFQSVESSKQTLLVENLRQVRKLLDDFYGDTGRYPESLQELVDKGYLKALPYDPVADSRQQWIVESPRGTLRGGVYNIRSGARGVDRFGVPFGEL